MKIRPEIEIYPDPKYCGCIEDESCAMIYRTGKKAVCRLYVVNWDETPLEYFEKEDEFIKCDQCKADCLAAENGIIEIAYPQIMFAVRWMIENIDTDQVDCDDPYEIKKLADTCHVAYLKET